jgi:glycosyltransferase involved in cell wall biosynthesis
VRIAAFISHPIQYFSPLWRELSQRRDVTLKVHYFSRQGVDQVLDPGFGVSFAWDIDLISGYESEFLPRQWPTRNAHDPRPRAINAGLIRALDQGWDVVFVNGYAHLNNWFLVAACERRGIPVLCFGDTNLRAEQRKPRIKRIAKRLALSQFMPRISAFLAAGGQSRAYFVHYGAANESVFICPYAVDVQRFRNTVEHATRAQTDELKRRWRVRPGQRVVMFCGKLVDWKRPLDLVHALRLLDRADVLGVFVGEGPMRVQIEAEGGGSVVVTGFVNQREIPLVLSLADVLVLSSSFEPYGMVVAEAQALGVPAIVSDACGCHGPESVVQDGISGFVYPTGLVTALANRLAAILDNEPRRVEMMAHARAQGDTQSQQSAADGFLAAVQSALLANRRAAP